MYCKVKINWEKAIWLIANLFGNLHQESVIAAKAGPALHAVKSSFKTFII